MPFALVTLGLILIVSGARDTYKALGAQIVGDFTGSGNFTYWIASIGAVGAAGYIKPIQPLSRAFLALILLAMVLSNGGIFQQFTEALSAGPIEPTPDDTTTPTTQQSQPSLTSLATFGDLATTAAAAL